MSGVGGTASKLNCQFFESSANKSAVKQEIVKRLDTQKCDPNPWSSSQKPNSI